MELKFKDWNTEEITGYKPLTTIYKDFSIADRFGAEAILDTYQNVFESVRDNYKYLTEFVMVLNWKIWEHYETNELYGWLYDMLWREMQDYAIENLKGVQRGYFYNTID